MNERKFQAVEITNEELFYSRKFLLNLWTSKSVTVTNATSLPFLKFADFTRLVQKKSKHNCLVDDRMVKETKA